MQKAYENGTGVVVKMSKTQLPHNTTVEGGFLSLILPALATAGKFLASSVLPSFVTGALTGIGAAAGSKAVDKIAGSRILYVKKGGLACKIAPAGNGLYLTPWQKGSAVNGDGLFMKSGSSYVDGSGLLLGPKSPFRDVPFLGLLL